MRIPFEASVTANLLKQGLPYFEQSKVMKNALIEWFFDDNEMLANSMCEYADVEVPEVKYHNRSPRRYKQLEQHWKKISRVILVNAESYKVSEDYIHHNTHIFAQEIGLNKIDCQLLHLVALISIDEDIQSLFEYLTSKAKNSPLNLMSKLFGFSIQELSHRIRENAPMMENQMFKKSRYDKSAPFRYRFPDISDTVMEILSAEGCSRDFVLRTLLGSECRTELTIKDYNHLFKVTSLASKMLQKATKQNEEGFNILLYGPPGTGKTELAKVMAKSIGSQLFSIGEKDKYDGMPTPDERIALFQMSNRFLKNTPGKVLLFDEMEDLFERSKGGDREERSVGSKVFINRLLETNCVPTIWTCNNLHRFDPAIIRRMSLAIEVKKPNKTVRKRVWQTQLKRNGVKLENKQISSLCDNFNVAPALTEHAIKAAAMTNGGLDEIKLVLEQNAKAVTGKRTTFKSDTMNMTYAPQLLNPDFNLDKLTQKIKKIGGENPFSFCLYGPPGTGKSAYIRHLAEQLGMEVIEKRASDLISMWVGGTEANIAEAFEEAREEKAFLIFDEADSFLQSRAGATRSWEVTQVNEMLTWMECHPYPFACTTNLMDNLDQASLRRFTFKVKCDYLSKEQNFMAFEHFFKSSPPIDLGNYLNLTPGDFATVWKKACLMDELDDIQGLLEKLRVEAEMKNERSRQIGFSL